MLLLARYARCAAMIMMIYLYVFLYTVEPPVATLSHKQPPFLSDQFCAKHIHCFPKCIVSQVKSLYFGTSCKLPPLVSDRNHF